VMFRGKRKYTDARTSTAMRSSRERMVENIVDQTLRCGRRGSPGTGIG
jgi:hypothetical protein